MGEWDHSVSGSAGIYHYNKGTDQMFLGLENKFKKDKLSLAVFGGVSNNSNNDPALLVDLKESYKYDNKGIFSNNIRVRNTITDGSNTTQIRVSPFTVNIPITKNTSAYLNTHYVGKYNYNTKEYNQGAGAFLGGEIKFGSSSLDVEVQRYNIQNWKKHAGNWGVNAIYTINF